MTDNKSICKGVVRSRRNLPAATRHERATTEAKARSNPTGWNTWNTVLREKLSLGEGGAIASGLQDGLSQDHARF